MVAERRVLVEAGRFRNMRLGYLREQIDEMEGKIFDATVGEVYRGWEPKVRLNAAYMRAKAEYARRTGDIKEANRLEGTWDGIEQRIEGERKNNWDRVR